MLRQDQRQLVTQRIDPKLILANAILQQSSLELTERIESELIENPALDVIEQEPICQGNCSNPALCPICSQRLHGMPQIGEAQDAEVLGTESEYYVRTAFDLDDEFDPMHNIEAEITLQDHLRALLRSHVPAEEQWIGEYIINCLDSNGWLDASVDEIASDISVDPCEVDRVLKIIQSFDPPGVGARDLRECMLLQLRFLQDEGHEHPVAEKMIRDHFEDVAHGRVSRLARRCGVSADKARSAVEFIRTHLHPYPANRFRPPWALRGAASRSSVRPDVVITRNDIGYEVEVVGSEPFVLGVNPRYREAYDSIKRGNNSVREEEKRHVTEYVERAELFIRNIKQRRRTLRMITRCIIDFQQGFLETGSRAYLRPLTRTRVAEALGMHESTVSRATSEKYVQLPNQEVVPFDLFFNPSLSIKTAIEEIISSEDPGQPLSDQRIVEILRRKGYNVARRTIVKYRDAQKILASSRRRR